MDNNLRLYKSLVLILALVLLVIAVGNFYFARQPKQLILNQIGDWLPSEFILESSIPEQVNISQYTDRKESIFVFKSEKNLEENLQFYLNLLTKNTWKVEDRKSDSRNAYLVGDKADQHISIVISVDDKDITQVGISYVTK
ncbi:MAG: hypothetical protein Q7S73_02520 [bacterium]|nr:hypothetical protein [bacterium]